MNRMTGTESATLGSTETAVRLDFESEAASFSRALGQLDQTATKTLDAVDFDPKLRELIRIRASQLNGCAYCIDMHTKDARTIGETEQRLYGLSVRAETPFFTNRERAALAFTEALTLLAGDHVPGGAFAAAAAEFTRPELAALISLIVTINAWNAIGVSTRMDAGILPIMSLPECLSCNTVKPNA
jgi:AhpD family alkylhydroperoxidase